MCVCLQLKDVDVTELGQCIYPRSPALALGFVAALSLLVAQIIINAVAGCLCCKTRPPSSNSRWTNALICFILSWYVHCLLSIWEVNLIDKYIKFSISWFLLNMILGQVLITSVNSYNNLLYLRKFKIIKSKRLTGKLPCLFSV